MKRDSGWCAQPQHQVVDAALTARGSQILSQLFPDLLDELVAGGARAEIVLLLVTDLTP